MTSKLLTLLLLVNIALVSAVFEGGRAYPGRRRRLTQETTSGLRGQETREQSVEITHRGLQLQSGLDDVCCNGGDESEFFFAELDLDGFASPTAVRASIPGSKSSNCPSVCSNNGNASPEYIDRCENACICRRDCETMETYTLDCISDCAGDATCEQTCKDRCQERCVSDFNGYTMFNLDNYEIGLQVGKCVSGDGTGDQAFCDAAKAEWAAKGYTCIAIVDVEFTCTCDAPPCDKGAYDCPARFDDSCASASPSASPMPSASPSSSPSASPTAAPTAAPTESPTFFSSAVANTPQSYFADLGYDYEVKFTGCASVTDEPMTNGIATFAPGVSCAVSSATFTLTCNGASTLGDFTVTDDVALFIKAGSDGTLYNLEGGNAYTSLEGSPDKKYQHIYFYFNC